MRWVKKERLHDAKMHGGLGFRELEALNMVLLAKQVWRFHVDPCLSVAQLLKAKYFYHRSIFEASLGNVQFVSSIACGKCNGSMRGAQARKWVGMATHRILIGCTDVQI